MFLLDTVHFLLETRPDCPCWSTCSRTIRLL